MIPLDVVPLTTIPTTTSTTSTLHTTHTIDGAEQLTKAVENLSSQTEEIKKL